MGHALFHNSPTSEIQPPTPDTRHPSFAVLESVNPFDRLARFYDWEHAGFLEDLPFYQGLAERVGGPILEAACGSGRLLVPLARAGYEVVGVDSSPAMLKLAAQRLASEPKLAKRVRLLEEDLRSLRLQRTFGLAFIALDSFGLFIEREDQLRVLAVLREHLHSNALLAIDVANGNLRGGEAAEETVLHTADLDPAGDRALVKWVVRRTDHAEQLDRLLYLYDESGPDGAVHRSATELELRYFTCFELELLLERAGFFVEAVFGDYDLTPYGPDSQRLIAVAHVKTEKSA
jgi:SAM-dependent methyltransferase